MRYGNFQANWWTQGNDPAHYNGAHGQLWTILAAVDPSHAVPTVPTGLAAVGTSSSATILSWNASSVPGNGFVTGYTMFENRHQRTHGTGHECTCGHMH